MLQGADRNISYYHALKVSVPRVTARNSRIPCFIPSSSYALRCASVRLYIEESTSDYKSVYGDGHRNHFLQNLSLYPYMH
jgi:hypothetical protein